MEKASNNPQIYNVFKPVGVTSYDVIRHFKRNLPCGFGKIGHFGTLDPFASGVLLIAVGGATRLNEYIHNDLTKTYLAVGKLGVESETGDNTVEPSSRDESLYLKETISTFTPQFIEEKLREEFLGPYMQSPHRYSAAKFEGKALHKWAREGVNIRKEEVERTVYDVRVVKYSFPYLSIRFEVSSGTYIRTLFSDCARYLGTYGLLIGLLRESIGSISYQKSIQRRNWPKREEDRVLPSLSMSEVLGLERLELDYEHSCRYRNGIAFVTTQYPLNQKLWIYDQNGLLLGLGISDGHKVRAIFNLPTSVI